MEMPRREGPPVINLDLEVERGVAPNLAKYVCVCVCTYKCVCFVRMCAYRRVYVRVCVCVCVCVDLEVERGVAPNLAKYFPSTAFIKLNVASSQYYIRQWRYYTGLFKHYTAR
jgi:hypothetical protein